MGVVAINFLTIKQDFFMASEGFINANLNLYLQFEYLTAEQFSSIVQATNEVYKIVANALKIDYSKFFDEPGLMAYPVPLCLQEVRTGNSIEIKFSFAKRFFPEFEINNKGTLNVILPKWSAILILSGMMLTYGLDIRNKILEGQKMQAELHEKAKIEVQSQTKQLNGILSKPNNPTVYILQQNISLFQAQVVQPNIQEITINGQRLVLPKNPEQ
jgi:hypothetical protein